jgi:signal transduction histidine kinase
VKPLDGFIAFSDRLQYQNLTNSTVAAKHSGYPVPSTQDASATPTNPLPEPVDNDSVLADYVISRETSYSSLAPTRREQRRWQSRLTHAMTTGAPLMELLRLLRDGIVAACGFDRAGVFLYDPQSGLLRGVWSTDLKGRSFDASSQILSLRPDDSGIAARLVRGEIDYYLVSDHAGRNVPPPNDPRHGISVYALVPLMCSGSLLGMLYLDNAISGSPITPANIEQIMPFVEQGALAIHYCGLQDEMKNTREILFSGEKLRAVGELASGVAHNVNNVLAAVQGYAELIHDSASATAETRHFARIIQRAVMDGAAMVQRIQRFARTDGISDALPFELARVAAEAIDLTRPAWHNQALAHGVKIEVVSDLTPDIYSSGIASELREVLVNLIKNAVDAMPTGGVLTVRCRADGNDGVLTVTDTGMGMSHETQQRIFEPFFTTKSNTRGTGLGLSVAWGIIHRHGGRINVRSAPGQGTTLEIRLPRISGMAVPDVVVSDPRALNGLRVLLVEDEEIVAGSLGRILAANGAVPTLVQDADEALTWLASNADQCDVIVSDHGMPGTTGLQLLQSVRERYPHLRRALFSGWGPTLPGVEDASAAELLLIKPIRQGDLVDALLSLCI